MVKWGAGQDAEGIGKGIVKGHQCQAVGSQGQWEPLRVVHQEVLAKMCLSLSLWLHWRSHLKGLSGSQDTSGLSQQPVPVGVQRI